MEDVKIISENELRYLSGLKGFNLIYLEKDYFLTLLLYLLKDTKGLCFKGGTALNKIFLNQARLSEDLDFTCQGNIESAKDEILRILKENKDIFPSHSFENQTRNYFRLKAFYKSHFTGRNYVVMDINAKASILIPPKLQDVKHFYEGVPKFEILTLEINELFAEKIRALITRNQPREYFDTYMLLEKSIKINTELVRKKLKEADEEFDIGRIFKNAKKIYSRWDDEMSQLTNNPVEYITVIRRLQKEFGYKSKA